MKLNVSEIQRFSVGDGEGIRTTVFLKGCNLHCPWCHNPETLSAVSQTLHFSDGKEKICGRFMLPSEIYETVSEDLEFFTESGGGVTISGGEAMLQADGVAELGMILKRRGIHVILDTAGNVPYKEFEKINSVTDEFLYDWKAATPHDYEHVIGGDFKMILDNLCRLIAEGKNVRVRIPLIEGFNTENEYTEAMCQCLRQAQVTHVDLLPFHRLGSAKYKALGVDYAYGGVPSMTISRAQEISKIYEKYFNVRIEK